jgi:hypothetical protein
VTKPLLYTRRHWPCNRSKSFGSSTTSPTDSSLRAASSAATSSPALASSPLSSPATILYKSQNPPPIPHNFPNPH